MGYALVQLVLGIIFLAKAFIIVSAILSWLLAFDVINPRNRFVGQLAYFLDRVTAPLLAPVQRVLPTLGGIDLSPIVVLLLLQFVETIFMRMAAPALVGLLG